MLRISWIFLLVSLAACAFAGCGNRDAKQGEALFREGRYEEAADAFRRAEVRVPDNAKFSKRRGEAETQAAIARYQRGVEAAAAGRLDDAVKELERAVTLDPFYANAKAELARQRPRLAAAREAVARATTLLDGGEPLQALEVLTPVQAYVSADPGRRALLERARRLGARELRQGAEKRLQAGDVEGADQDLARARRLEEEAGGAQTQAGWTNQPEDPLRPGPGEKAAEAPAAKGGDLDAYAKAGVVVKRLTRDLPKRRPGGGIAKPQDYALSEDDVLALDRAIADADAAKPPAEKTPQWLSHGRIVLRMAREVAGLSRVATARRTVEAGDTLGGWLELDAARRIDPSILESHEAEADVAVVRAAVSRRLVEIARRELDAGYPRLARLRARQAREVGTPEVDAEAQDVLARSDAVTRGRPVIVMPFLDYTTEADAASEDPLTGRFQAALMARLGRAAKVPLLEFAAWQRERGSGAGVMPAALVKGDILRLAVMDARDAAAIATDRIAAESRRVQEARRRRDAAPDAATRARAQAALDDAERGLARAERERASSAVAATQVGRHGASPLAPGDVPVTATLEVQFQLHDPETGLDFAADHIVKLAVGRAADRAHVVERLLEEAVEPIAAAVEARLYDVAAASKRRTSSDARGALETRVASLEADASLASREPGAALLEATGYSYAEKRTIPAKLRLE